MADSGDSFSDRMARESEDAIARLIEELVENPLVRGGIQRSFELRERAAQVQELLLAALNIPSASDIERLTRRIRSVSQRMEALEDGIDRLDERLASLSSLSALEGRLDAIDARLATIAGQLPATASDELESTPPAAAAPNSPSSKRPRRSGPSL